MFNTYRGVYMFGKKKKKNKKGKPTAGEIKDDLAERWRKSGSLGKNERVSTENASKTMKAAKEVMKENPLTKDRFQLRKKTQEKLKKQHREN